LLPSRDRCPRAFGEHFFSARAHGRSAIFEHGHLAEQLLLLETFIRHAFCFTIINNYFVCFILFLFLYCILFYFVFMFFIDF